VSPEKYLTRFPIQVFDLDDRLEVTNFCGSKSFNPLLGCDGAPEEDSKIEIVN